VLPEASVSPTLGRAFFLRIRWVLPHPADFIFVSVHTFLSDLKIIHQIRQIPWRNRHISPVCRITFGRLGQRWQTPADSGTVSDFKHSPFLPDSVCAAAALLDKSSQEIIVNGGSLFQFGIVSGSVHFS